MTIREAIIKQFEDDFVNLRLEWGYALDYNTMVKGYTSDVKQFPTVCFYMGVENLNPIGDALSVQDIDLKLGITVFISASANEGKLTTMSEQVISDIKKFIHQDTSIQGAETSDHKVLKWGDIRTGNGVGVQSWNVETVFPYLDNKQGKGEIDFTIGIKYYEFQDSIEYIATL